MRNSILAAAALVIGLGLACPASSQTYRDSGGTILPGFVPIAPGIGPIVNQPSFVANHQTATTSAAALPAQALVNGATVYALTTNVGIIYIGPSGVTTSTGWPLNPGDKMSFGVTNLSALYMVGQNTTDVLAYAGN
jgi:hypothetical protein